MVIGMIMSISSLLSRVVINLAIIMPEVMAMNGWNLQEGYSVKNYNRLPKQFFGAEPIFLHVIIYKLLEDSY